MLVRKRHTGTLGEGVGGYPIIKRIAHALADIFEQRPPFAPVICNRLPYALRVAQEIADVTRRADDVEPERFACTFIKVGLHVVARFARDDRRNFLQRAQLAAARSHAARLTEESAS